MSIELTPLSGLRAALCAVVAMGVLTGCGGAQARYATHLQRGQQYLDNGNLDKAGVEFRNAAQIKPKSPAALYYIGRVAEARNNFREAYGYYQAALDADASYLLARAAVGKMLVFGGDGKRAMQTLAPGLVAHPDDAGLLAVRAAAHHQMKEREAARADAEHAVQLAPANEDALTVLAALLVESKEYPRATQLLSDAVARAPSSVPLHEVLTNLYLMSGDAGKAEEQMRKVIELRPMELSPRSQLARHLARAHDLDGAQRVLEDAVRAFCGGTQQAKADQAKLLLVDFISQQRSREQGEKTLREFIAREPHNLDLRLGLGSLLQRTGALQEALTTYQEVVDGDGTGAKGLMARDRMAAIHFSQGHADVVRKLVGEVLQKSPGDDDALILRSTLEMQHGDANSAIADLRAVLRDQPGSVELQRSLAAAYLAKGQLALAEETLRAAMQSAPSDATAQVDLAGLLVRTNRAAQGAALLEETAKRLPDNTPVHEALITTYLAAGNLQNAATAAQDLKRRQPQSAAGFYYAGLVASREQRWDESRNEFAKALELRPDRLDVLTALVRVEMARGAFDAAVKEVGTALERDPKNVPLLNLLGGLYLEHKDYNRAADYFSRASQLAPGLWQPHRNLAAARLGLHDTQSALVEYRAALKLAPAEPELVVAAAELCEKQGLIDEAIAGYEALYKSNPNAKQFAANNLAMLLVTYKKDQASLDRARDLTSNFAGSNNGPLLDTAGWVHFKRGEYRDALPTLERALEQVPDSKVIRFHLGMAQLQLGQRDRALSNLESSLSGAESFQGSEEARVVLASLKSRG